MSERYYQVDPAWFARRNASWQLEVDAFADAENAVLPRYWTKADDAFSKDWRGQKLWVHCPYEQGWLIEAALKRFLVKSFRPSRAVLLAPWQAIQPFYYALSKAEHIGTELASDLEPFVGPDVEPLDAQSVEPLFFVFCCIPRNER